MPNRKLVYEIETDTSDAVRDMRKLATAGKTAGKELGRGLAAGFDDAESAGTRALSTLTSRLDGVEAEFKGTAAAVKAIGAELGAGFDSSRVETMVGDLRKMGLEFDAIVGDAKEFAAVMSRADGIKLDAVNSGLTNVGGSLERVGTEADQSRSVMANLAGNSMQSAFGALGGTAGDLGMALGQISEYAAEGNIKLSNLAAVAGPMAALAGGTFLLTQHMADLAATKAWEREQVDGYAEAIERVGEGAGAVNDYLREAEAITGRAPSNGILGSILGTDETVDITDTLAAVGVTVADVAKLIADPGPTTESFFVGASQEALTASESIFAFGEALLQSGMDAEQVGTIMDVLADQQKAYREAIDANAGVNRVFRTTTDDVNAALRRLKLDADPFSQFQQVWKRVIDDLRDGKADLQSTGGLVDFLAGKLGLTTDGVLDLVDAKLDEELEAVGTAAEFAGGLLAGAGDAAVVAGDDAAAAADNFAAAALMIGSADYKAAGIEAANTAMREFMSMRFAGRSEFADVQAALDTLFASVDEHGTLWTDKNWLLGPEGRDQLEQIKALGETYMPRVEQAYADADGSQSDFIDNMHEVGSGIHQDLVRNFMDLGDSFDDADAKANALMRQMGYIPENVTTMFQVAGIEAAKAQLQLLAPYIDALTEPQQIRIGAAVARGDFVAAQALATSYLSGGVLAPVHADLAPFHKDVANLRTNMKYSTPVVIPAQMALVGGRPGGSTTTRGDDRSVAATATAGADTYAAAPTAATAFGPSITAARSGDINITVPIHAAVIGDRYAVQRVVARAVRSGVRLAGVRK